MGSFSSQMLQRLHVANVRREFANFIHAEPPVQWTRAVSLFWTQFTTHVGEMIAANSSVKPGRWYSADGIAEILFEARSLE